MGVEAMTRMMLSDTKLLKKLKESLAKMAAPLQEDARIFQNKITEASERLEEATRERTSLSSELLRLKEDIDALGQRKKLVADQMHLLLVQFERDSAVYTPEGPAAGEEAADGSSSRKGDQGGRGDIEVAVVSISPTSSAAGSAGGFVRELKDDGGVGDGGVESDVVSFFSGGGGGGVVDINGGPVATTTSSGGGGGGVADINGGTVATTSSSGGGGGDEDGTAGEGIVVEPMDDDRAVGEHDLAAAAASAGGAGAAAAAVSGGGTSEGEYTTGRNNNNNNNNASDDDRCSSSIRSRSSSSSGSGSGCCEGDSTDDDGPLDGRTHQQEHALGLPGAPAAAAAGAGADGTPFTVASKHEDPGDASSGSPAAITLPGGPLGGKNTEMMWNAESDHSFLQHLPPPPSWKPESIVVSALGEEGTGTAELSPPPLSRSSGSGNCSSAVGRGGGDLISSKPRTPRVVAVSPRPGRSFSPPSSPKGGVSLGGGPQEGGSGARGRLSGGARGDDDGTARGFGKAAGGDGSGAEEKDTAWRRLAKWVGSSSGSTVGGGGGTSAAAAKLAAVASAGSSMSYSRWFPGSRLSPGSEQSGASLSPTPWSRRRGKKERPTPTLMEELYQDLAQLRTRLEEVQAGIDDKSDMYATLYHSYTRVLTEAEEAEELKRALSSQMIQLLFEQEQRLEGYLREWITFDGGAGPGFLAAAAGDNDSTSPGVACGIGGTLDRGPGGVMGCNGDVTAAVAVSIVTDAGGSGGDRVDSSPGGEASPGAVWTRASGVGSGGRNVDGGVGSGDEDDDDGGFEKVDAWMVDGDREGAPQTGREGASSRTPQQGSFLETLP
ncbi:unnamed protein product [Ectocarpus sp. 12 AP-2014]